MAVLIEGHHVHKAPSFSCKRVLHESKGILGSETPITSV
jgi:hypothetical protein